ncbi:alpha/beta hydrolase, partial [Methylobacterium radiotolerans]
ARRLACAARARRLSRGELAQIEVPVLVSVGTLDTVAGSGPGLAALIPGTARALEIEGKDHSTAVGAKPHRDGVLAFLAAQP